MFKKILIISVLVLFPTFALGAAYVSFSSQQVNYEEGKIFSVPVYIGSNDGEKIYTAKVSVSYDSTFLEVTSFSFKEGGFPLAQEGYDKIDNTNGVLIKTAGYPGGISTQNLFGTITFKSKKTGSTKVSVSGDSQLLNESNENILTSKGVLAVVLGEKQKQVSISEETELVKTQESSKVVEGTEKKGESVTTIEVPKKMNPVFFASISLLNSVHPVVYVIIALICLGGVIFLIRKKQS